MRASSRPCCIFCGEKANSDEDVFPEWLLKVVGQQQLTVYAPGRRPRKAVNLRIKARLVCETCNNGWMSRLEQRAIPVLTPMLKGEALRLSLEAQVVLAQWAIKTSMLVEHLFGQPEAEMYWTQEERTTFAAPPHRRPFEDTQVFLGTYSGTTWTGTLRGGRREVRRMDSDTTLAYSAQFTVICKAVFFHVISDRYRETTGRIGFIWPPPHFDRLEPLAERQDFEISWPLARTIGEKELAEYSAGRFLTDSNP